jgi:alkylation response protein AidB-like acyl-CoA dehydrogenase
MRSNEAHGSKMKSMEMHMATATARKPSAPKQLPPPNSDFYNYADLLNPEERAILQRGGNGILTDYNVARFFADAEAFYPYEGTYQMQHLIVGKAITGFSAFV